MRSSSQKRLNLYCQLDFWSYVFSFQLVSRWSTCTTLSLASTCVDHSAKFVSDDIPIEASTSHRTVAEVGGCMSKTSRSIGNRRVKWLVIQGDSYEIYVNRTLSYFVFTFGWDRIEQNGDISYKTHPEHWTLPNQKFVERAVWEIKFLISELDDWSC